MSVSIIESQIGVLKSILSDISEHDKNKSVDFIEFTNQYFCFETNNGWNILMNAFYIFDDIELAKKDFQLFGLQGPSRHENTGEKYLRLYGILNALYQQYSALINLMELFKLSSKRKYIDLFKQSESILLRNKTAAHSSNYLNHTESKRNFDVYEISRHDLEMGKIVLLKNQDIFETYNLKEAIANFDIAIENVLSEILKKFIKKKFNNQGKHYENYKKIEVLKIGSIDCNKFTIKFV